VSVRSGVTELRGRLRRGRLRLRVLVGAEGEEVDGEQDFLVGGRGRGTQQHAGGEGQVKEQLS